MKRAKARVDGSASVARARPSGGRVRRAAARASPVRSMPRMPRVATASAATPITAATSTSLSNVNGVIAAPAATVVPARPAIIRNQTMVAAGARRSGETVAATRAKSVVPAVPTPIPTPT